MRLSPIEFDRLVNECMDIIPPQFRTRLQNLVFVVEAEPRDASLLGLFEGRPAIEKPSAFIFEPPARITVGCSALALGAFVEIDCVAYKP